MYELGFFTVVVGYPENLLWGEVFVLFCFFLIKDLLFPDVPVSDRDNKASRSNSITRVLW